MLERDREGGLGLKVLGLATDGAAELDVLIARNHGEYGMLLIANSADMFMNSISPKTLNPLNPLKILNPLHILSPLNPSKPSTL